MAAPSDDWVESSDSSDGEEPAMDSGTDVDQAPKVTCLFCDQTFGSSDETLLHCSTAHDFHLLHSLKANGLDFYDYIRIVNFIRNTGPSPRDLLFSPRESQPWVSDRFLTSTLEDDLLLTHDVDGALEEEEQEEDEAEEGIRQAGIRDEGLRARLAERRAERAEQELARAMEDMHKMREVMGAIVNGAAAPSRSASHGGGEVEEEERQQEDEAYFGSYAHFSIHEEMLKDTVRTGAYRDFIYGNPHLFRDKVVLDVGCGTGILSLFAARSGARRVFAVEQSEIAYQAMDIVRQNGLQDIVTVLHGRVEDISLPVKEVDLIVSEWMGYFLLFESMLDSVLVARDRWLSPRGAVYPDVCALRVAALCDEASHASRVAYWGDVYGFRMASMLAPLLAEPSVERVAPERLASQPHEVKTIDCCRDKVESLEFTSNFSLKITQTGSCTGLVGYFDVYFSKNCTEKVMFSTAPGCPGTHWKQTVFLLEKPIAVSAGSTLEGTISCRKQRKDRRSLDIVLTIGSVRARYFMQ
ncbi:protein arginine N-methyltransferase 3 [Lampetra fluviatilis]